MSENTNNESQVMAQDAQPDAMQDAQLTPEEEFSAAFEEDDQGQSGKMESSAPSESQNDAAADDHEQKQPPEEVSETDNTHGEQTPSLDEDQRFRSMMGRLKAAQAENANLKAQVAAIQAKLEERKEPAANEEITDSVEGLEDIPEDIRPIFREKGRDGDTMRKLLDEYGPEHASIMAQSVMARRSAEQAAMQMRQQYDMDKEARHKMALAEAHPAFADAIMGRNPAAWDELRNGITAWIGILPYSEGTKMMRIVQEGTTQEVSDLLSQYETYRRGASGSSGSRAVTGRGSGSSRTAKLAQANVAVPRSGYNSFPKEKANDFDSAWDEAPD